MFNPGEVHVEFQFYPSEGPCMGAVEEEQQEKRGPRRTDSGGEDGGRGTLPSNMTARHTILLRPFDVTVGTPAEDVLNSTRLAARAPCPGSGTYATLLYSDSYLPGVLVLAASLREVGSSYGLVVLIPLKPSADGGAPGLAVSDNTVRPGSARVCVCVCVWACVWACVCVCVRVCECE